LFPDGVPSSAFTNKAGSLITYYFPKIVEYTQASNGQGADGDRKRNNGRQGTENINDEDDTTMKRGGTTGDYTQEEINEGDKNSMDDQAQMDED
jgi:hypothetical protein